jgi:hypothetical protein
VKALHLARRFFGSLPRGGPPASDEAWVRDQLLPGEVELWARMSDPDRRHAVGVARDLVARLDGDAARPVVAAALLHDVGKIVSGLGTFARVAATLVPPARARGRIADYRRHPEHGARLLGDAGSDSFTITWTAEHHLPPDRWSLPAHLTAALKAADDD